VTDTRNPVTPVRADEMQTAPADPAQDRNDFIKRLFAVAVSVGFAAHIDYLKWIASFSLPDETKGEGSALLLISMITVVASWEGYLASLRNLPLRDISRFVLDIIIVFEYLVLMTLYTEPSRFLTWLCVIFFSYLVWDYCRVYIYRQRYGVTNWFNAFFPFVLGLACGDKAYKGPSITFFWFLYFIMLAFIAHFNNKAGFWLSSLAMVYGILVYRFDKAKRLTLGRKLLFGLIPGAILLASQSCSA